MDQKNNEIIDIERCKELFEYEMTEVVLMLKGEFATVSGKDLGYSKYHVSEEKRNALLDVISKGHITPVQVQPACIFVDIPAKIAAQGVFGNSKNTDEQVVVSGAAISKADIGLPDMPSVRITNTVKPLSIEPLGKFAIPEVIKGSNKEIPELEYDLPEVQLPAMLSAPAVAIATEPITPYKTSMPDIPRFNVNLPVEEVVPSCVKIPDMTRCADYISSFDFNRQPEKIALDKRQLDGVSVVTVPTVVIHPVVCGSININVPNVERTSVSGVEKVPEVCGTLVAHQMLIANKDAMAQKLNKVRSVNISGLNLG